ncbi:hypothetical protein V6Z11_D08G021100 [Gossypium hirsutum]
MQEGCDSRKNSNPVVGTRTMYKDMEDFLFKMLGEEFRLERDAIQVLNRCGYDMQKVVDAFVKGDQDQANKILEQAHQADEESNYRSFETRLASCSSTMFAEEPC